LQSTEKKLASAQKILAFDEEACLQQAYEAMETDFALREELAMTTARAGLSMSASQAYREKMFNLLANRDPLEVLTETASTLADTVGKHSATVLRTRPFEGKWTPNEVIGHLTDSEWVYGYRLRLILCEDDPAILGTQQDLWVAALRHNEREPSELVEIFRTMRLFNLAVWRRTSPEDLKRTGQHNERGPESLGVMLRLLAGHDLSHLDQINRYIQAVQQRE
jgi:hypothetical protein